MNQKIELALTPFSHTFACLSSGANSFSVSRACLCVRVCCFEMGALWWRLNTKESRHCITSSLDLLKIMRLPGCMLMQSLFQSFSFFPLLSLMPLWPSLCSQPYFSRGIVADLAARTSAEFQAALPSSSQADSKTISARKSVRIVLTVKVNCKVMRSPETDHQVNKVSKNRVCSLSKTGCNWDYDDCLLYLLWPSHGAKSHWLSLWCQMKEVVPCCFLHGGTSEGADISTLKKNVF